MASFRNIALATFLSSTGLVLADPPILAGYRADTNVLDHANIDMDQRAMENYLGDGTSQSDFTNAQNVYTNGGNSKTVAQITLTSDLASNVNKGDAISGVDQDGNTVNGSAYADASQGTRAVQFQYKAETGSKQCRVGGLLAGDKDVSGCLKGNGNILIAGAQYDYDYNQQFDHTNGRTISDFSAQAEAKMSNYKDFKEYNAYYGTPDYANQWVNAALLGTATPFTNGNADFSLYQKIGRVEGAKKGSAYMSVWMYVIRELEDAIDDCNIECDPNVDCNDDAVHAWDEAVAFYTGSLEGSDGSGDGYLMYSLADKRCQNFNTCGPRGDASSGTAKVNLDIYAEFASGQMNINLRNCDAAHESKNRISQLMGVPLIQGTLRYAHKIEILGEDGEKERAEGAVFAAAILPRLHACNPADAATVYENMRVGAPMTSLSAVRSAFESNYECMGVSCSDVGALYNADSGSYYAGESICSDSGTTQIGRLAGYLPDTNVVDHAALDNDQKAIEAALANGEFSEAQNIYEFGGYSKSYAHVTLTPTLTKMLPKGTPISGLSNANRAVSGVAYEDYDMGSSSIKIQYVVDENSVPCNVGGLPSDGQNRDGCFAQGTGKMTISGQGEYSYAYENANNQNGRTIKGFSTGAQSKMYDSCPGCPYKDFEEYYNYYGEFTYADQWVTAALERKATSFANGNADFSSYGTIGRREAVKKGSAYMSVWMYIIRELEDAIDDCNIECDRNVDCNDDAVHAWDEAVAFYTGSLEGSDGSGDGYLMYSLADKRCQNFKTCGPKGDSTSGTAKVNLDIYAEFASGQMNLNLGNCDAARESKNRISQLMGVPLIQGTLRYAHKIDMLGEDSEKEKAEGAVFAAAILPRLHACSPGDAETVYNNMRVGATSTNLSPVRSAFESNLACMGIEGTDVGGIYNEETGRYFANAGPMDHNKSSGGSNQLGIILGAVFGGIAAISLIFIAYMMRREKTGNPVFKSPEKEIA